MGFFSKLFGGKAVADAAAPAPQATPARSAADLINDLTDRIEETPEGVDIWDFEAGRPPRSDGLDLSEIGADAPASAAAARARRNTTRLIGFDTSEGDALDLFDHDAEADPLDARLPVGWVVVVDGPGYGAAFTLGTGLSQIGRGDDQTVALDFGDATISRSNHAAIVYDPLTGGFTLGHGGKANIVRLNGEPLVSDRALATGDRILIGETELRFVAFCDESFAWPAAARGEETGDAAAD